MLSVDWWNLRSLPVKDVSALPMEKKQEKQIYQTLPTKNPTLGNESMV